VKKLLFLSLPLVDILIAPFCLLGALLFYCMRRLRMQNLPFCKAILFRVGVYPILDHYYEPLFNMNRLAKPLSAVRSLPAIPWNVQEQLETVRSFSYRDELLAIRDDHAPGIRYTFNNGWFDAGDAEYWYSLIRSRKPRRIIEIGSGKSTLMAMAAVRKNCELDASYSCKHICIEPFENAWLDGLGIQIIRKRVEEMELSIFADLSTNDLLFIDSSHMIRPQGDVLFEYLNVLPSLNDGVIVHIHDIFTPRDYLSKWLKDETLLWNEQYLLEAFLCNNKRWKILGALNHLHHEHFTELSRAFPVLQVTDEPKSFYLVKVPET
jgi:hypothetical protein